MAARRGHGTAGAGEVLRGWRARRRVSQLELALAVGVSARHLSFVETGRSGASRELLLALAEQLEMPLRERNALLLAAGYAPRYAESDLGDDALGAVHEAVEQLLTAHEPFPTLAVDRWGDVVRTNRAVGPLLVGVDPALLAAPINIYRLSLHPDGLAPRIRNLAEWGEHLCHRLQRLVQVTDDARLADLLAEIRRYGIPQTCSAAGKPADDVLLPLHLAHPDGDLQLYSTMTTFGAPRDVTLAELALESFLPADASTRRVLDRIAANAYGSAL